MCRILASSPDGASRIHDNSFVYNSDGSIRERERVRENVQTLCRMVLHRFFLFPAEGPVEEEEPVRHSVTPNSSSEMGLTSLVAKMANYHLEEQSIASSSSVQDKTTFLSNDVCRQLLLTLRASILGLISIIIMHRWPVQKWLHLGKR